MKRPKRIKVGPQTFVVRWKDNLRDERCVGATWKAEQVIAICESLPEDGKRTTLVHELLHCVAYVYGAPRDHKDFEEGIVNGWAAGLIMLLHDNPKLVEYLTS